MRGFIRVLLFWLSLSLPLSLQAFVAPASVTLESTDWGDASQENVQAVLNSVLEVITPYMTNRQFGTILIRNSEDGPVSLYTKGPHGEYIIDLNVKGRHWAQLAYQFSHEMCHLLSNYDLAPHNSTHQQWFEESLCEAFSLATLDHMAIQWTKHPPYSNWTDFAPKFTEYKQEQLDKPYRYLTPKQNLRQWYNKNRLTLENDPYADNRHLNELIAVQLLPVFESIPMNWTVINYLNLGDDSKEKSLAKYFHDWQENAPPDLRATVKKARQLFLTEN